MSKWRMLTVHQPWATCIARGRKRWENRDRDRLGREPIVVKFARSLKGQWVAIHASNQAPRMKRFPELAPDGAFWPHPTPWGVVVCTALIGDVVGPEDMLDNPWRIKGSYGIELTYVRRFAVPVPVKGGQGWVKLASRGDSVLEAIIHAHDEAANV